MFTSIDVGARPRLRDLARERLRTEILDGTLPPGARLDDEELAGRLRCSRTPVREALSDLAHTGLVELRPNRYTRVTVPRREHVVPALQALGLLFGGIVRTTVPTLRAPVRTQVFRDLGDLLDRTAGPAGCPAPDRGAALYRVLIAEHGNPLLAAMLHGAVDGLTFRLRHPDLPDLLPWPRVRSGIATLRVAVDCRDGDLAERASSMIHLLSGPGRHLR